VNDVVHIFNRHISRVLLLLLSIIIIVLSSGLVIFDTQVKYINSQLNNNIKEYQEIDREQLCKIAECKAVYSKELNKFWTCDANKRLIRGKFKDYNLFKIEEHLYIDISGNPIIYNQYSDTYFYLDVSEIKEQYVYLMIIFMFISLVLVSYPMYITIKKEREENIIQSAGSEALLANKTMINITENIHHELNTPLEVIDNKLEKIYRIVSKFIEEEDRYITTIDSIPEDRRKRIKKINSLKKDFDFIKMSSEQIYSVLEKMKGFKHLRYSNGNKTLYNIIDGGFKIINISNSNFNYSIDEELCFYSLMSKKIKNADLLSIVINHFKNSLEAGASKLIVKFISFENNIVKIRILDNGSGIPDYAKKSIFLPNFSTKSDDNSIRGNGMYLNKYILNTSGGDVRLVSSSNKGTTIELSFPSIER